MKRREFITILGAAATWPFAARAQTAMPVIGWLNSGSPSEFAPYVAAFHQGLKEIGYEEGHNVTFEYRWADGHNDRLPALAADLVHRQVAVISGMSATPPAFAAKAATSTIPIVFVIGADPVKVGLVASLNRPGGNLTGVTAFVDLLVPKRLELLRELAPKADVIGFLLNPTNPNAVDDENDAQTAARQLGLTLYVVKAASASDIDLAFATLAGQRIGALLVDADPFYTIRRNQIIALAARHLMPVSYPTEVYIAAGGLFSYGTNRAETFHQAGIYVGRILKGEKPADLPVLQPTKFELAINIQAAKVIGLTIPESFLLRADKVIE
jgi:putative ABC transport system substrate-binding protein